MSSDKTSSGKPLFEARLCHVSKRADFDGYGFNLHAEKGRAGQFIGKVDEGSPAESAGLRQGDRIIEVNGANIGNETHKQVVERIKSIANDTHLLVVDPKADISDPQQIALIDKAVNAYKLDKSDKTADKSEKIEPQPTPTPMKEQSTPDKNHKEMNNSHDKMDGQQASKIEITPKSEGKHHNNSHDAANNNNNTVQQMPSPISKDETGKNNSSPAPLNLKMTAAELRAQLAAKKKYDPKNSTVDLREKYNMIQKL